MADRGNRQEKQSERFLGRAYALETPEEGRALYREWAASYDRDLEEELRYIAPASVAAWLADSTQDRDLPVLDVGCGTGLVAENLTRHGFKIIDGLDFSPEMLAMAEERGIYRELIQANLNGPLDLPTGFYGAAISCGTFTHGHVGASALDEILRLTRPGSVFAFTVHREVWQSFGFERKLNELEERSVMTVEKLTDQPYFEGAEPEGRYCLVRRL